MNLINLNFVHPQYGTVFNADVDAALTASEMINNLILSGFIPQSEEGYLLALKEQLMQAGQPLITLDGLDNGSVLRIVENKKKTSEKLIFYIKHPLSGVYAPAEYNPEQSAAEFAEDLKLKGFIGDTTALGIFFQGNRIDYTQKIPVSVPDKSYLELKYENLPAQEELISELSKTVAEIKSSNDAKLQQILDYLPPASAIPVDPERAVNPTLDIYETVDSLIADALKESKLLPPQKISLWNPLPLILGICSALLLIILTVLYSFGVFG